jgi:methionine synthase II (cobalamin-independent)
LPTVHLSLPEQTYRELRERAQQLGIQVTDLIKIYIKMGLERGFTSRSEEPGEALAAVSRKVDRLERDVRIRMTMIEGRYRQLEEALNFLIERVEMLEEAIAELKASRVGREAYDRVSE